MKYGIISALLASTLVMVIYNFHVLHLAFLKYCEYKIRTLKEVSFMKKKVIIVGAGPGGLSTAMLLTHKGYDVVIFEKNPDTGGRNDRFQLGAFTFDVGPTFLMLPQFANEIFALAGKKMSDYVEIKNIDPLYRIKFNDGTEFFPSSDLEKTISEISRVFPEDVDNYIRFKKTEGYRYNRVEKCFKAPYTRFTDFLRPFFIEALPQMDMFNTLQNRLKSYFTNDRMRYAMSFQTKYIGMSPWKSPSAYSLIPYIEHKWGVHHVTGGLNRISKAMAEVVQEYGGIIHTSTPVRKIISKNRKAIGVTLENGENVYGDYVVINADFAYAMSNLVDNRKKYTEANLRKREYSASTFMLYLGVKKQYDISHHNLIIGDQFRDYMDEITMTKEPSTTSLVYIHNPVVTDKTLAPEGNSSIYVLVPVPNKKAPLPWDEIKSDFRNRVLDLIKTQTELKDLENNIIEEKIMTPDDWVRDFNVYNGAVFNLSHAMNQMFYFRPHNKSEELDNCYIVGGGTHPGSGLPTIYISAVISSELIIKDDTGDKGRCFDKTWL